MPEKTGIIFKRTLLIVILFSVYTSNAQEMWGIAVSNYAGSNGAMINPSSLVDSKLYMDINLLAADVFVDNNYVYIHGKDFSLGKYLTKNPTLPSYPPYGYAADYFRSTNRKNAYVSIVARGPSFMMARGRHAFSFYTGSRVLVSAANLPYDIANFAYHSLKYSDQYNIEYTGEKYGMTALVMSEVGVSYAYSLLKYNMDDIAVGVTLKGLFGLTGGYTYVDNSDYIVLNDSSINIKNMTAEMGMSLPVDYNTNDYPYGPQIKGTGVGMDIGITYQRKLLSYQKRRIERICRQRYNPYIYKIGISLLDIGAIKYTQNAQTHSFENVSKYWVSIDTISYHSMNTLMGTLSNEFYGDPNQSLKSNSMSIFLPAAASLQADYRFYRNWYVAGAFIHPLQLSKSTVHRPTQIMLAPRYETSHIEFSIPVSLYEWRYPRVGLAFRYEFLTIGTDKLNAFFGIPNFTGMDFYFSIKFNFRKGYCGKGRNEQCGNNEYGAFRLKKQKFAKHHGIDP